MTSVTASDVTIFVGPSLSPSAARAAVPGAVVGPPAGRNDLYRAREQGAAVIVLIDGLFAQRLAVSPREVVEVAHDGAHVIGASSMGALRAVDCQPANVAGIGLVYRLFRRGVINNDDEVAVSVNPKDDYAATSVALVNVRYAMSQAKRSGLLDASTTHAIVDAATRLYFTERTWPAIFASARAEDPNGRLTDWCERIDIKRRDAHAALKHVARIIVSGDLNLSRSIAKTVWDDTEMRYPGHQRYFGEPLSELRMKLCQWLVATGRYLRYVWPLLLDEVLAVSCPDERSEGSRRAELDDALNRLLSDFDGFADRLWSELYRIGVLDNELARWYAYQRLAIEARRTAMRVANHTLLQTWHQIGRLHRTGAGGAAHAITRRIPLEWISSACESVALASSYADQCRDRSRRGSAAL